MNMCKDIASPPRRLSDLCVLKNPAGGPGITASSMFPGLDGACEELKELRYRFEAANLAVRSVPLAVQAQ